MLKKIFFTTLIVTIAMVTSRYFFSRKTISLEPKTSDTLIIGTTSGYAPFVSLNETGEYEGFDIDFAKELAQKLGKKLEIKDLGSMTSLFMGLEQKQIDAIIWALSVTQDRLKKVAMIPYQGDKVLSYPLVFWKKIPETIKKIEDMQGLTVCVEPGSAQEAIINKYPGINKKNMERVIDSLTDVQYGKSDAVLLDPSTALEFKRKFPHDIQTLEVPLAPDDQSLGNGVALRKDDTALIELIEKAVRELKQEGIIARLEQKWGLS